jgi:hypothetical protein
MIGNSPCSFLPFACRYEIWRNFLSCNTSWHWHILFVSILLDINQSVIYCKAKSIGILGNRDITSKDTNASLTCRSISLTFWMKSNEFVKFRPSDGLIFFSSLSNHKNSSRKGESTFQFYDILLYYDRFFNFMIFMISESQECAKSIVF